MSDEFDGHLIELTQNQRDELEYVCDVRKQAIIEHLDALSNDVESVLESYDSIWDAFLDCSESQLDTLYDMFRITAVGYMGNYLRRNCSEKELSIFKGMVENLKKKY